MNPDNLPNKNLPSIEEMIGILADFSADFSIEEFSIEEKEGISIPAPPLKPKQKVHVVAAKANEIYTIARCLYDFEQKEWLFVIKEDEDEGLYPAESFILIVEKNERD